MPWAAVFTGTVTVNIKDPPESGVVTTHVPESSASEQSLSALPSLQAAKRFVEVTVYGATPPDMIYDTVPPVSPFIDWVAGRTVSADDIVMSAKPLCPSEVAVTLHTGGDGTTEGAVNFAVAKPLVVSPKGSTVPQLATKPTAVPSGGWPPVFNLTAADIVDVPSGATTEGLAVTVTELMVIGSRKSE